MSTRGNGDGEGGDQYGEECCKLHCDDADVVVVPCVCS